MPTHEFYSYEAKYLDENGAHFEIPAKLGDKKGAIEAAKKSLEVAEKAGNADYVKMNTDSLKEWGGM